MQIQGRKWGFSEGDEDFLKKMGILTSCPIPDIILWDKKEEHL